MLRLQNSWGWSCDQDTNLWLVIYGNPLDLWISIKRRHSAFLSSLRLSWGLTLRLSCGFWTFYDWRTDRSLILSFIFLQHLDGFFFITLLINVLHLFVTPNSSWMISNNCLGGQGAPVYKISVPLRYFPIAVTDGSGILSRENSTHFSSGVIHSPRAGEWKFLSKRMKIKL